jgi:hypothetical protein
MSISDILRRNLDPVETPMATGLVIMAAGTYGGWPSVAIAGSLVILLGAAYNMLLARGRAREDDRDGQIHPGLGPFE